MDLTDEQRQAMETAFAVLGSQPEPSPSTPTRDPNVDATQAADASFDSSPPVNQSLPIRRITSRNDIPLVERHVLVMWGMATTVREHSLGATFAVDNSRYSLSRDRDFAEAIAAANDLACKLGLNFIYVWD